MIPKYKYPIPGSPSKYGSAFSGYSLYPDVHPFKAIGLWLNSSFFRASVNPVLPTCPSGSTALPTLGLPSSSLSLTPIMSLTQGPCFHPYLYHISSHLGHLPSVLFDGLYTPSVCCFSGLYCILHAGMRVTFPNCCFHFIILPLKTFSQLIIWTMSEYMIVLRN